jgi:antirestriction protein ArdC
MSIYQTVTDRILTQLKAGVVPWRKPWTSGLPRSLASGKEYRGINILMLATTPFESSYWLTFRQAQHLGGHVRKGEKATPVVFWKWRTPEELKKLQGEGKAEGVAPCVPFVFPVFNLDQVEGVERPKTEAATATEERHTIADQMLGVMPSRPEIVHSVTSQPAYFPKHDRIRLPHLSQFRSGDHYYAVLFHELVHSTGHASRLNRFRDAEGDRVERYSLEELVAEFGAAFLCGFAGIRDPGLEDLHASYIDGWSEVFARDPRILLRAASAAQKATDYVRGKLTPSEASAEE